MERKEGDSAPQQGSANGERERAFDFSGTGSGDEANLRDRARNAIGAAGEKLADVGSSVRDRAGNAREKLADVLESGASRLRERTQGGGGLAGATTQGSTAVQSERKLAQASDRVASGMERSANWLRQNDLETLKMGIESQVKEHPGRTLLIAVGLGYLVGRAFRNRQ